MNSNYTPSSQVLGSTTNSDFLLQEQAALFHVDYNVSSGISRTGIASSLAAFDCSSRILTPGCSGMVRAIAKPMAKKMSIPLKPRR